MPGRVLRCGDLVSDPQGEPPWGNWGPLLHRGSEARDNACRLVRSTVRIVPDAIVEMLDLAQSSTDEIQVLASVQPSR